VREVKEGEREDIDKFQLPLNIDRIIESAKTKFKVKDGQPSDLNPKYVLNKLKELHESIELVVVVGEDPISREANDSATVLFKILLRCKLAFKRLVKRYYLNALAFDHI